MAKPNKKNNKSTNNISPTAIVLDDPSILTRKCISVIRASLDSKDISFVKWVHKDKRGRIVYSLQGGLGSKAIDPNSSQESWVISIPPFGCDNWLGVSLTFNHELKRFRLEGISIRVFRGLMTDPNKAQMFRAEWDASNFYTRSDHAQPHWHVSTRINNQSAFEADEYQKSVLDFDEATSRQESRGRTLFTSDKFHFPMSSSWHIDDKHQIDLSSEQYLLNWLKRCIGYIQRQLEYTNGVAAGTSLS
ncbi:MAG: hypothetical protein ACYC7L_01115 [Nitrospirota bacterium]